VETVTKINELDTKNWSHKLGTVGGIVTELDDIKQCYETIFVTQKGTVVLNPNLGWEILKFISRPMPELEHEMRTELIRELNWQEPRGEVTDVTFSYPAPEQGNLAAIVSFIDKSTGTQQITDEIIV
jgi:phage baseplate assembly protein W